MSHMLSRFKLEKGLAVLLLITVVAIVGERQILKTSLVIDPSSGYTVSLYDDRGSGGNSTSRFIDASEYKWQCSLRSQYIYAYCGFEIILDPNRQNGLDLQAYDSVRISLDYEGAGKTVRVYLRNYDPIYSKPGVYDSTKYNQIEFGSRLLDKPVDFKLADFFVANWWFQRYQISPQQAHPQFDNTVIIEIQTGSGSGQQVGEHKFQLNSLEFSGQVLPTEQWYQAIMGAWLVVGLLFIGFRIIALNRELWRKNLREQELIEINALLDARSQKMEELSKTDPLTGVFNRQGVEEAIKLGLNEWRRERKPLSIVMLDVDHFKRVNDTHGHAKGDHVLTEISTLVQANTRSDDLFARWGGEEFVLVCRNTAEADAARIAENLRAKIEVHDFDGISITASFGVADLRENESLEQLFVHADTALYRAKDGGRNRVVVSSADKPARLRLA